MEGSLSESVFISRNLNPRLFVNEVLNSVDDLVDGAFELFLQKASENVGASGGSDSELEKGISVLRNVIQAILDKRLSLWEKYCFQHIFVVPEGFSTEETGTTGSSSILEDALSDADLDSQIQSLRHKLFAAERESVMLTKELHVLEDRSASLNEYDSAVKDVSQLYEQISMLDLLKEVEKTAPIFHKKFKTLKDCVGKKSQMMYIGGEQQHVNQNAGLSLKLEDLKQVLGFLKKLESWESSV